jgi:serine-type D-Ala-D-Ala carboxypeptidase (penicillin-binding protein 5/6)
MALPVLERVERRRRRRRRAPPLAIVALVLVLAAGGAGAGLYLTLHSSSSPKATGRRSTPPPAAPRPTAAKIPPTLVVGPRPLAPHRFTPPLSARAAILVDARTGRVLWALRPHLRRPIASTTKIMTAVLALQKLRPRDFVTIDPSVPRAAPFREGLVAGQRVRAWKLFYGLLLFSGNDDALALAIGTAGSRGAFIGEMNREARRLGLRDTHFSTPSGVVDRNNYSTAWDMAALARYALRNPRFRAIVRTRVKHVRWPAPTFEKVYLNKNALLRQYRGADGVKTGWTTKAGHCLVASAQRGGAHLIAVVLAAPNRYSDAARLLSYGFRLPYVARVTSTSS